MDSQEILIVYHTTYGSTKQYAEWIQEQVGGRVVADEEAENLDLSNYDLFIFGGSFLEGRISIRRFMINHWQEIQDKQIVLFSTSGRPTIHPGLWRGYEESFPRELRERIAYFPLRGRVTASHWALSNRILMQIDSWLSSDPDLATERGLMTEYDGVQKRNLDPLLTHVRQQQGRRPSKPQS